MVELITLMLSKGVGDFFGRLGEVQWIFHREGDRVTTLEEMGLNFVLREYSLHQEQPYDTPQIFELSRFKVYGLLDRLVNSVEIYKQRGAEI